MHLGGCFNLCLQLTSVNLGNNRLACLPHELSRLPKLTTLHVFGNQIGQLVPDVIGKCVGLSFILIPLLFFVMVAFNSDLGLN